MCCFSPIHGAGGLFGLRRPRVHVSETSIFARRAGPEQALIYSMKLTTPADVAMILPLPVLPGSGDTGLRFVDLQGYHGIFNDFRRGWPVLRSAPRRGRSLGRGLAVAKSMLEVHRVGAFDASYVPSLADFSRLDPQFRLPTEVWERLPTYADYGFAVFKLRKGADETIHPMALRFVTRDPRHLFFPTVHIHDGKVHAKEHFAHTLYWQGGTAGEPSFEDARGFVDITRARGLVDPAMRVRRQFLGGKLPNIDTWVVG